MTKQTTILVTVLVIIALGILCLIDAYGQERTLIYEYNNYQRKDFGGGQEQLIIEFTPSYRLYEHGDTLINVSSQGTIKEVIKGKSNQKINKIGSGAAFEHVFDIDADSFVTDFSNTDFDIDIDADTVFFRKNGRLVATKIGLKVFDDLDNLLTISKIEKVDKKIKYKYDRPDKTKKAKVDPTWSWQPDETDGIDAYMYGDAQTTNYGASTLLYMGVVTTPALRILIKASALTDSIPVNATITSAQIIFTEDAAVLGSPSTTVHAFILKRNWVETEATWKIYSTGNNWGDSGAYHTDDIYLSDSTVTTTGVTWTGLDTVQIGDCIKKLAGVNSTYANNGILLKLNIETTGSNYGSWSSSDHPTPANRPLFKIDYSLVVSTEQIGILRSPLDGTIEDRTIKRKVNYP